MNILHLIVPSSLTMCYDYFVKQNNLLGDEILLFSTNLVGQENSTEISNAKSLLLEDGIYSPGHEVTTQALEEYGIFEALK